MQHNHKKGESIILKDEIHRELTRKEIEKIKVGTFTVDCVAQHINAFAWQSNSGITANFAEPCVNCPHIHKCHCDWLGNLEPLFKKSRITFNPVNRVEFKDVKRN